MVAAGEKEYVPLVPSQPPRSNQLRLLECVGMTLEIERALQCLGNIVIVNTISPVLLSFSLFLALRFMNVT